LAPWLLSGADEDEIAEAQLAYVDFTINYTGSIDDNEPLGEAEKVKLAHFVKNTSLAGLTIKRGGIKESKAMRAEGGRAYLLAQRLPHDHYLVKLSKQMGTHQFNIEAAITAQHVYFLNSDNLRLMDAGYRDYTKLRKDPTAVLRIRKVNVPNHVQDMSDERARMTRDSISGAHFEIMINTLNLPDFLLLSFRSNPRNWQPLKEWTP